MAVEDREDNNIKRKASDTIKINSYKKVKVRCLHIKKRNVVIMVQ